jgi:hypothetical protein
MEWLHCYDLVVRAVRALLVEMDTPQLTEFDFKVGEVIKIYPTSLALH